ncbi:MULTISPECIES: ABC transporter permease [Paenibacillus]|uniref:Sugar ABC transporter permease n=1 Tax=Paenibacillus lignilyticus TaxID=1172615 RepID=A0ABS5C6U2_9BACL|nr:MULTISPECIES: ABC transporter permease subunit [Paenibacillus]MBP3961702.1 sugar ABC transporter permease [Paenibacillus lignilyticus]MBP3963627.1 sugar ABC transporter permease [Paenibacillus lignilyticus]SFS55895.1 putative aldouronate transport system permease protein [Paenibacillus sp. BC26]
MAKLWQKESIHFHIMLLPALALVLIFQIYPMSGIVLAFKDFVPTKGIWGSPWAGFKHFLFVLDNPESATILRNTLIISFGKIITLIIVPVIFALMLNEIRLRWFKRTVQTVVYLPHFLSWVVVAGILKDVLSLSGPVNWVLHSWFGLDPQMFLGSNEWFRTIIVSSNVWKEFGFSTIIYLAALTNINPSLYEAAEIDGAGRFQKLMNITLPGIAMTIALLATLSLNGVLNAGFDQVFNMYNVLVMESGDIIDTYVYRSGLMSAQYEMATAIGLLNSVVSFILVILTYTMAYRFANYRIF